MARSCTICSRSDAGTIAEMLGSGRSVRAVALELGLSDDALGRHARHHLSRAPIAESFRRRNNLDPLDELTASLRSRALAGDPAVAREYRLALAAQSAARHATAPVAALETTDEWIRLRTVLLEALEPFPEARLAVAEALE